LLLPAHCSLGCQVTQVAAFRRIDDDMLAEQGLQTLCLGSKFDALNTKVNVNSPLYLYLRENTQLFYYKEDQIDIV
jgi:hypothetical protein